MSIKFFDVGQGNCSLIVPSKKKEPALLVDCGSSSSRVRNVKGIAYKDTLVRTITGEIRDYTCRGDINDQEIVVLISHADEDHYCLLVKILSSLVDQKPNVRIKKMIFGGNKEDYTLKVSCGGKKIPFGTYLEKLNERGIETSFPAKDSGYGFFDAQMGPDYLSLFIPSSSKNKNDKNGMSIISQVRFDNKRCLLMGDATNNTTDDLQKFCSDSDLVDFNLQSDILLASHHGSSDNCNSKKFLSAVNPKFVVFSSGVDQGYRHPRESVVKECLEILPNTSVSQYSQADDGSDSGENTLHHSFYFGLNSLQPASDTTHSVNHARYSDSYGVLITKKNIFGTLGQGDILFELSEQKDVHYPKCLRKFSLYNNKTKGEVILEQLNPGSEEGQFLQYQYNPSVGARKKLLDDPCFSFKNILCLNLMNLQLTGEQLKNLLVQFTTHDINHETNIERLYLNQNNLSGSDELIMKLCELVSVKESVVRMNLEDCGLSDDQKSKLQDAWGYRGLKL